MKGQVKGQPGPSVESTEHLKSERDGYWKKILIGKTNKQTDMHTMNEKKGHAEQMRMKEREWLSGYLRIGDGRRKTNTGSGLNYIRNTKTREEGAPKRQDVLGDVRGIHKNFR